MKQLEFYYKYGNYEIKATPKRLARFSDDEPNETIDLRYWEKDQNDNPYCYSIAYFTQKSDGEWDLRLVGNRFFECVKPEDYKDIMSILKSAYNTLISLADMVDEE